MTTSTLRNLVGHALVVTGVRAFVPGEHRAERLANTHPYKQTFQPAHCAGPERSRCCFQDHPGDAPLWTNAQVLRGRSEVSA